MLESDVKGIKFLNRSITAAYNFPNNAYKIINTLFPNLYKYYNINIHNVNHTEKREGIAKIQF